jgi:hypothetical protein
MGLARQLKFLAPVQVKCFECHVAYVPYSKDLYRQQCVWLDGKEDWLSMQDWIADRSFQANMKFCSPKCKLDWDLRETEFELERHRHKNYGKRK